MKWTPSKGQVSAARRAYVRNAETKYFDVGINVDVTAAGTDWANSEVPCDNYVNSSGVAAAYTDSCLIPTANGSGYGQVIGNKYNLKKLRVRGMLQIATQSDAADVGSPVTARIMLVRDKQPNGAQAQGEDVMQDLGAFGENAFSFMRVADNVGRFEIIKDKTFILNRNTAFTDGTSTGSVGCNGVKFKFDYMPKDAIKVSIRSGNATPTIAGTINENIFMLAYANALGAVSAVRVFAASRAYYCE